MQHPALRVASPWSTVDRTRRGDKWKFAPLPFFSSHFLKNIFKKVLILLKCIAIIGNCLKECNREVKTLANIKSSKKDILRSKIAYEKNKANKTAMKTTLKKFEAAVAAGERAAAEVAYKDAIVVVDKAVTKGILHKNTAARKKSSLTLQLNKLA